MLRRFDGSATDLAAEIPEGNLMVNFQERSSNDQPLISLKSMVNPLKDVVPPLLKAMVDL